MASVAQDRGTRTVHGATHRDAIAVLERYTRDHWEHYVWLAACYAAADKQTAAHEAGQQAMALRPNLSITAAVDGWFKWKLAEDKARLRAALAQAQLPP